VEPEPASVPDLVPPTAGREPTATTAEARALLAKKVLRSDREGDTISLLFRHGRPIRRIVLAP
jgi:hypothetical protein